MHHFCRTLREYKIEEGNFSRLYFCSLARKLRDRKVFLKTDVNFRIDFPFIFFGFKIRNYLNRKKNKNSDK